MSNYDLASMGLRAADPSPRTSHLGREDMDQGDFLTLMVAQLKNQDPLNPLGNEEFVAQMAQFSTLSGVTQTAETLSRIEARLGNSEIASAASWIGRTVTTAAGDSSEVTSVSMAAGESLSLTLADGRQIALSDVTRLS